MTDIVRHVIQFISFKDKDNKTHSGIAQVYVLDKVTSQATWWSIAKAHDFISGTGNLWVEGETETAICYPRSTTTGHKYIQTKADDTWTDNLLSLPVI